MAAVVVIGVMVAVTVIEPGHLLHYYWSRPGYGRLGVSGHGDQGRKIGAGKSPGRMAVAR